MGRGGVGQKARALGATGQVSKMAWSDQPGSLPAVCQKVRSEAQIGYEIVFAVWSPLEILKTRPDVIL